MYERGCKLIQPLSVFPSCVPEHSGSAYPFTRRAQRNTALSARSGRALQTAGTHAPRWVIFLPQSAAHARNADTDRRMVGEPNRNNRPDRNNFGVRAPRRRSGVL